MPRTPSSPPSLPDHVDTVLGLMSTAKRLAQQAAAEGRHNDSWKIYKNMAKSAIKVLDGSHAEQHLRLAVEKAGMLEHTQDRVQAMQFAFDEMLGKGGVSDSRPATGKSRSSSRPGTGSSRSTTYSSRNGLSEAHGGSAPGQDLREFLEACGTRYKRNSSSSICSSSICSSQSSSLLAHPGHGPAHLQSYLHDLSSRSPTAMYKSSSAPYFEATPHRDYEEHGAVVSDSYKSSHFTKLGAPKTNSHFNNTLPGANMKFSDANPWRTSNSVFFDNRNALAQAYEPPVKRNPNFQYVNGDQHQGLSTWQSSMLPGYHRSKVEVNGLGLGST